jgi:Polyketide cyclase / dehydrase and lipid transport
VPRIEVGTTIARRPDDVWRYLRDIPSHVEWMADAKAIRLTSTQPDGVGTTFECDTRVGPLRLIDRMQVTHWQEGRSMGVRHVGLVTGSGRFVLRPDGESTRFTWTEDLTFPWWLGGRFGGAVGRRVLARVWRRNLRGLKERLESR